MDSITSCAHIAHAYGYDGSNVGIAYLDTGIFLHKDFTTPNRRLVAFVDFISHRTTPYDDNGHGTHIVGIASSSSFGIAPNSNIIMLKVLDYMGNGTKQQFIKGLDWIHENHKKYQIHIVNVSIGTPPRFTDETKDSILQKVNRLWDDGLIVCIASGNNGPRKSSISSPGNSKKVITVGSSNDEIPVIGNTRYYLHYSSRGPTFSCIMKPDVVAPGTNIASCNRRGGISVKSGTSMATPFVSGAMALLKSRYPKITNKEAKLKLRNSCDSLNTSKSHQGWGQINILKLLDLTGK